MLHHLMLSFRLLAAALLLFTGLAGRSAHAQSDMLVELRRLEPQTLHVEGFTLDAPQDVRVEATGAVYRDDRRDNWGETWDDGQRDRRDYYWPGNAWILNATTRELVWELREARTERGDDDTRTFDGTVRLPAGTYEVYYASYPAQWTSETNADGTIAGLGSGLVNMVRGGYSTEFERDGREMRRTYGGPLIESGAFRRFGIQVRGQGTRASAADLARARADVDERAFVTLRPAMTGDDTYAMAGFSLDRPTEIEVHAIGEAYRDDNFDYGWIVNADTRERVWTMDYRASEYAGGDDKNRIVRRRLTLPAGRYAAFFAADDSHHPGDWNAAPPFDPSGWGLALRTADRAQVRLYDYTLVPDADAFVSMTRVGSSDARSQGFTLRQPMDVRVFALGEGGEDSMYDFGWIVDARTHRRVWEMTYDNTEPAGGDEKNRLFDGVVRLPAGDYVAYYVTDDSHAYDDWNSSKPIGASYWGLTLVPAQGRLDRSAVAAYDEADDPALIVKVTRVRDGERERRPFTLDRETEVRIYALGEGDGDEMYDYGWIEDARTGDVVWEMDYRDSEHAGGASKNRLVDTKLRLPAGNYVLHYRTDGSHAFGDWNDAPPSDPINWGITLSRAERR